MIPYIQSVYLHLVLPFNLILLDLLAMWALVSLLRTLLNERSAERRKPPAPAPRSSTPRAIKIRPQSEGWDYDR
jgi:hypothetical protein